MTPEQIFASIFGGLVFGGGGGYAIFLWKRYKQTKRIVEGIKKQKLKFRVGEKKEINLLKEIEDERRKTRT